MCRPTGRVSGSATARREEYLGLQPRGGFDQCDRRGVARGCSFPRTTPVEQREGRLFADRFGKSPVPVGILISPDGRLAYIANTNADLITVIDLESLEVTGRLKAGQEPDGMGFSPLVLSK